MKKIITLIVIVLLTIDIQAQSLRIKGIKLNSGDSIYFNWQTKDSILTMNYDLYDTGQQKIRDDYNKKKSEIKLKKKKEITKVDKKDLRILKKKIKPVSFSSKINFMDKEKFSNTKGRRDTIIYNGLVQLYKEVPNSSIANDLIDGAIDLSNYLKNYLIAEMDMSEHEQTSVETNNKINNDKTLQFNMKVFTDANGFIDKKQPNGLLQTEGGISVKLFPKVEKWSGRKMETYFVKNLAFQINLFQNKNDSSFRYSPVYYERFKAAGTDSINKPNFPFTLNVPTLNLIKYSHYSISAKLNIVTLRTPDKAVTFYGDIFGTFYSTGVTYDSITLSELGIRKEDASFDIYSVGLGWNAKLKFAPPKSHFNLDLSFTDFGITLLNNNTIKQSYGKVYYPEYNSQNYNTPKLSPDDGNNMNAIQVYSIQIRYSATTRNIDNLLGTGFFFRFNYYTNPNFIKGEPAIYGNSYMQIQTGISKNLDELISFLGLKKTTN